MSGIFGLGAVGGCVSHTPCGCGQTCPNTWTICTIDGCSLAAILGASITVKNSSGVTVGTCTTGSISASPCAIPNSNLTLTYANPTHGGGSTTLTYNSSLGTWSSPCITFAAGQSFNFTLSVSGGNWAITINVDESSTACGSPRVYTIGSGLALSSSTCSPLSVVYTASGRLNTTNKFTSFTVSGGTPTDCCTVSLSAADTYTATISKTGYLTATVSQATSCKNTYMTTVGLYTGSVTITVYNCDSVTPMAGATVAIHDPSGGTTTLTTNSSGQVTYTPGYYGSYPTTISKTGYLTKSFYLNACANASYTMAVSTSQVCCPSCSMPRTLYWTDDAYTALNMQYGGTTPVGWYSDYGSGPGQFSLTGRRYVVACSNYNLNYTRSIGGTSHLGTVAPNSMPACGTPFSATYTIPAFGADPGCTVTVTS